MDTFRLMGFDLDGTLLDPQRVLRRRTADALALASDRGCSIAITSGRNFLAVPEVIRDLPFIRYFILCNGALIYDREKDEYFVYQNRRIDASYHGTGDLFSSSCVGEIMKGHSWQDAMRIAADYTARTIEVTLKNPEKPWYGVDFEATIPDLVKKLP